ncbi:Ankyrin repeat protein [Mycena indigotica]|uniref:Ankyrin repeat protein n=1 Tax=Mycena indigotica TaxID=2126181 RepID=A0A8H6SKE4_9AGAR|nr:Ankyrin repeat protein [Mycena indigotica]KAF7300964.1 Ankyrin repeat protein [Mycena indigotica]
MAQTPEAEAFIQRVLSTPHQPGASLDPLLQPSLDDETDLRRLFATDKANPRLSDPYVGLVDVFAAPVDIRTTRARVVNTDLNTKYVMPLSDQNRRSDGEPSMVTDIDEFKKNWGVFSEGSLSQLLDWNNVVAAGGSVLACLTPLSPEAKASKRAIRKYYHSAAYPTSDVDLFLWGLTPEQAEAKIVQIYEAVRDSVPWDVTCVRTKHTISIHSQYPYRSVQIVLRLYSSPAEILAGFDIDAPCVLFNGSRVYANPRAIVAMMRQCNTVDMTRRSPSYEVRLAKYSGRAYEVYVPTLSRSDIDPTIYERSIARITGLARLLVLEKLTDTDTRFNFLESRRTLRGRSNPLNQYNRRNKRKFKGDLKADSSLMGMEMNDYDVASLHIPYGPGWDARRIDKLVYQTDLGMNSTFNPKNKGRRLHRHPAFFGTIQECIEDCCENCPQPIDEDERKLQADESDMYIQGRISFIQEDPGRQSISGSFNPIDVGEWSAQVYIGPTEKFFTAIASGDRHAVAKLLKKGQDVNRRDHVGRMPIHVAILCRQVEIACDLIDAGARMTSRLVDGRTSLHLAAQMDLLQVVEKLLKKSTQNKQQLGETDIDDEKQDAEVVDPDRVRMSSEDDWSSDEDDMAMSDEDADSEGSEDAKPNKTAAAKADAPADQPANAGDLPEEEFDTPDVFDINLPDWDLTYSPLAYAIVFGSLPIVETLLAAGADAKAPLQSKNTNSAVLPLTLTIVGHDEDRSCKIAERLIAAGASCSALDTGHEARTIFCRAVEADKAKLVATFLRCDPNAKAALNYPQVGWSGALTPLVAAVSLGYYSTVATLVAYGVKIDLPQEDVERAFAESKQYSYVSDKRNNSGIEAALVRHDDMVRLLTELGGEINAGVKQAMQQYSRPESRRTYLDWVRHAVAYAEDRISEFEAQINPPAAPVASPDETLSGWAKFLADHIAETKRKTSQAKSQANGPSYEEQSRDKWLDVKGYLVDTEKFLVEKGAKTWQEVFPDQVTTASEEESLQTFGNRRHAARAAQALLSATMAAQAPKGPKYCAMTGGWNQQSVPSFSERLYDELFEACYAGKNDRIQELCLPPKVVTSDSGPLQIAVCVADESGNQYMRTGFTPLFAAISGKHWDTARLIVTIAAAQYKAPEDKRKFTVDVDSDEDSDGDSEGYDSDGTVEQADIDFVDIAKRPSSVQCNASPQDLLQAGNNGVEPFSTATFKDDFDLFINAFRLYKHSPIHAELPNYLLSNILSWDRPEMLDEFIRRTGQGIKIETPKSDELAPVVNDQNKLYLGLNVHGKKRMDLAKRNDPNASNETDKFEAPLVWRAISSNAKKVLDYLLSERPLEAYRYYAATNNTDTSRLLKQTPDLDKVLPEWLGLTITPVGESPLTAALISKKMDIITYLFSKLPKLMSTAVDERIKFLGVNTVSVAVQLGCDKEIVDFLLAQDISPAERDQNRGWNIFHYMADNSYTNHNASHFGVLATDVLATATQSPRHQLLEHLLKELPRDVVEALLAQQSYGRQNTPLHVAVQNGNLEVVKQLLNFSTATVLVRNVAGSIPLHLAIRPGYPKIAQLLINAAPEGLYMENGVGETPLEMAGLQNIISQKAQLQQRAGRIGELGGPVDNPPRIVIPWLESALPRLRSTLDLLATTGALESQSPTHSSLTGFVEYMEKQLVATKARVVTPTLAEPAIERANSSEVFEVIRNSMDTFSGQRLLVHLLDVQASVQNSLARLQPEVDKIGQWAGKNDNYYSRRRQRQLKALAKAEGGLDEEEDADAPFVRNSLIFPRLKTGPDPY